MNKTRPKDYSEEQKQRTIDFFVGKTFADLRKRQRLTQLQIERVCKMKRPLEHHLTGLKNLRVIEELLREAVDVKSFGK